MRRPKVESNTTYTAPSFRDCLAKTWVNAEGVVSPGRSVLEHCQIVGSIAQQLAEFLPKDSFKLTDKNTIGFLASLHDLIFSTYVEVFPNISCNLIKKTLFTRCSVTEGK